VEKPHSGFIRAGGPAETEADCNIGTAPACRHPPLISIQTVAHTLARLPTRRATRAHVHRALSSHDADMRAPSSTGSRRLRPPHDARRTVQQLLTRQGPRRGGLVGAMNIQKRPWEPPWAATALRDVIRWSYQGVGRWHSLFESESVGVGPCPTAHCAVRVDARYRIGAGFSPWTPTRE